MAIRSSRHFPRGLRAIGPQGGALIRQPGFGGRPPRAILGASQVSATSTSSPSAASNPQQWGTSWRNNPRNTQYGSSGNGQSYSSQNQGSTPTAADLAAFQQALENAAALGVISTTEAAQYNSAADTATDAQLQQLTAQINSLVASTPSAAAAAADATAAAPAAASTSWLDGTTTLFGSTLNNSTLAIGAGLAAVLGYAWLSKKGR
jgi:hypothetical protein